MPTMKVYNGIKWVTWGGVTEDTSKTHVSEVEPIGVDVGDLWYDPSGTTLSALTENSPQILEFSDFKDQATLDITNLEQSVTYVNLRSEGLSLDGTTDESDAFEQVLANVPEGSTLVFDDRAHLRLSRQISLNGKRVDFLGYGGATIESTAIMDMPFLLFENIPHIRISGIALKGAETVFVNTSSTNHWALQLRHCDYAELSTMAAQGFSRGFDIFSSAHAKIDKIYFEGMINGVETWAINHMTMRVGRSPFPHLSNIVGKNCGSALYTTSADQYGVPEGGRLWGLDAINCWDNGIYIGFDSGWDIGGVVAHMTVDAGSATNTGVKMRGSRNKVHHSHVEGYSTGYNITGENDVADVEGAEGSGSSIEFCSARKTGRVGASISSSDPPLVPRDFSIRYCVFEECGQNLDGYQSIRVIGGHGHHIIGNRVLNQTDPAYAVLVQGPAVDDRLSDAVVAMNSVRNMPSHIDAYPFSFLWVDDSRIILNEYENAPTARYGMNIVASNRNIVTQNRPKGAAGAVANLRVTGDANRVYDNPDASFIDGGTNTVAYGNADNNPVVSGATTDERLDSLIAILQERKALG